MIIAAQFEAALEGEGIAGDTPIVIQDSNTGEFYDVGMSRVEVSNEHGQTRTVLVLSAGSHRYESPSDVARVVSAQLD